MPPPRSLNGRWLPQQRRAAAALRAPGAIAAPQSGAGGARVGPGYKMCVWSASLRVTTE